MLGDWLPIGWTLNNLQVLDQASRFCWERLLSASRAASRDFYVLLRPLPGGHAYQERYHFGFPKGMTTPIG